MGVTLDDAGRERVIFAVAVAADSAAAAAAAERPGGSALERAARLTDPMAVKIQSAARARASRARAAAAHASQPRPGVLARAHSYGEYATSSGGGESESPLFPGLAKQMNETPEFFVGLKPSERAKLLEAELRAKLGALALMEERVALLAKDKAMAGRTADEELYSLKSERLALKEAALTNEESAFAGQEERARLQQHNFELVEQVFSLQQRQRLQQERAEAAEAELHARAERVDDELPDGPIDGPASPSKAHGGFGSAQAAAEELSSLQREMDEAEEERYVLHGDIETLQAELEESHLHEKQYYESMMELQERIDALEEHKTLTEAELSREATRAAKLQRDYEQLDRTSAPAVGGGDEEADDDSVFFRLQKLSDENDGYKKQLAKAHAQLEYLSARVDDERAGPDHASTTGGGHRRPNGGGRGADEPEISYASAQEFKAAAAKLQQAKADAEGRRDHAEASARAAEREAAASAKRVGELEGALVGGKLGDAQLHARLAQAEAEVKKAEAAARKAAAEAEAHENELTEHQDNNYSLSTRLEEEQEALEEARKAVAEADARARRAEEALGATKALHGEIAFLKSELDDERVKREKSEAQLAKLIG
ncbi:hypothetical protein T492DRAFT_1077076 [Pavlovales sp. CCMP2436]|nr:hypothetical protein T492DRAFT_1077076 [Pavlovales sp. CCMP2436]